MVEMPELTSALVIFGGVLLLIGLVGGPFKIFGVEVPGPVEPRSRWMAGLMGVLLLAAAVYVGREPGPDEKPKEDKDSVKQEQAANDRFIEVSEWPRDDRLGAALTLALSGRGIERARVLLAEAGCPQGFVMLLPMKTFHDRGGEDADLPRIEKRLAPIGVRIERLGPEGKRLGDGPPPNGLPPCNPRK